MWWPRPRVQPKTRPLGAVLLPVRQQILPPALVQVVGGGAAAEAVEEVGVALDVADSAAPCASVSCFGTGFMKVFSLRVR